MKIQLEQRLKVLNNEFQAGPKMPVELQAKEASLYEILLSFTSAIQLIRE